MVAGVTHDTISILTGEPLTQVHPPQSDDINDQASNPTPPIKHHLPVLPLCHTASLGAIAIPATSVTSRATRLA
jgi:hypothetical protein